MMRLLIRRAVGRLLRDLDRGDDCVDLGTGLDPDAIGVRDRRIVRVDGETERSQAVLSEHVAVVWLTPSDGWVVY